MLKFIDNFLNKITMYRLTLYVLLFFLASATMLSFFGVLPYDPFLIIFSAGFLTVFSLAGEAVFSRIFESPVNVESAYITALILAAIIMPPQSFYDPAYIVFAGWTALLAIASKYIFAVKKKHVFNPAAFAGALYAFAVGASASWWVGTASMMPFVLVAGFLVVRKIRRFDLVASFLLVSFFAIIIPVFLKGGDIMGTAGKIFLSSPILFFAEIMLTEPLTTPPTRILRIGYGAFVGFLFIPSAHIGSTYFTPELALLAGNIFSYLVSPKQKLILRLKEKVLAANGVYDFWFASDEKLKFKAGQYLEWTLPEEHPDNRGNRRYFTILSSPTEEGIAIGVKFYDPPSTFKQKLYGMVPGDIIAGAQLAGDFTLPKDPKKKLVFISGGIGVTPFRSMIKYLLDKNEARDIVHFYSNKAISDIAYTDVFNEAHTRLGIETVYALTDERTIPLEWRGEKGFVDGEMILRYVPDYEDRYYYISGPHGMVSAFDKTLRLMGVKQSHIKKDFFPGFA